MYTVEQIREAGAKAQYRYAVEPIIEALQELCSSDSSQNSGKPLVSGSLPQPTIEQIVEDLDDKRICKFSDLPADMYYLSRKHTAEYLLDKYIIVKRQ